MSVPVVNYWLKMKLIVPDYTFVPALERATIDDYVSLFNASFAGDGKLNADYLRWQYLANPHGQVIGVDAYLGDDLVAHYAIIPRRYRLGTEVFDVALSVNTATHPLHQGKGLFTKLAEATYQIAAQRGVKFVVGAANANSVGGFTRKLGFTALGQIRLYAGFKAVAASTDSLVLDVQSDWLEWRLGNPSRRYERVKHWDGSTTLRTYVKGLPFNIARVHTATLLDSQRAAALRLNRGLVPGLAPFFGATKPSVFQLPLWVQPSPWHVIWRALDPSINSSLLGHLQLDGLSMDTF